MVCLLEKDIRSYSRILEFFIVFKFFGSHVIFENAKYDFSVPCTCSSKCAEHQRFFGAQGFYWGREAAYPHKVVKRYVKCFCNFSCNMCYVRLDPEQAAKQGMPLTTEQWISLAEEAKRIAEAENSGYVDSDEIDWESIGTDE